MTYSNLTSDQQADINFARDLRDACEDVSVTWTDPRLAKILRLRLLGDGGFPMLDVSYITGELKDGRIVNVINPFGQLPKRGYKKAIIAQAKRDKVFAKGLGVFDAISVEI